MNGENSRASEHHRYRNYTVSVKGLRYRGRLRLYDICQHMNYH